MHLYVIHAVNASIITVQEAPASNSSLLFSPPQHPDYDSQGAMCYVLFVLVVYGAVIVVLITNSMKVRYHENNLQLYMADIDKARKLALRQEKFKTRLAIHRHSYHRILGYNRADYLTNLNKDFSVLHE